MTTTGAVIADLRNCFHPFFFADVELTVSTISPSHLPTYHDSTVIPVSPMKVCSAMSRLLEPPSSSTTRFLEDADLDEVDSSRDTFKGPLFLVPATPEVDPLVASRGLKGYHKTRDELHRGLYDTQISVQEGTSSETAVPTSQDKRLQIVPYSPSNPNPRKRPATSSARRSPKKKVYRGLTSRLDALNTDVVLKLTPVSSSQF